VIQHNNAFRSVGLRAAWLCIASLTASASVLEVGSDRLYKTPCDAIQQAAPGDVILIAEETFSESCSWTTSGLTVRGGGSTTIRVAADRTAWHVNASDTVIEGITFLGDDAPEATSAAIEQSGGQLTLRRVRIQATAVGVRSFDSDGSTLTIEEAEVSGNRRNIVVDAIGNFDLSTSSVHDAKGGDSISTAAMRNSFRNNKLVSNSGGGRELVLRDSRFTQISGNLIGSRESGGSGVLAQYVSTSDAAGDVEITGNTFVSDTAGVLFVESVGSVAPSTRIERNVFWGGIVDEALGQSLANSNFFGSAPEFDGNGNPTLAPQGVPADWGAPAALLDGNAGAASPEPASSKASSTREVTAPVLRSLVLSADTVVGGSYVRGNVYLTAAAPAGGVYVRFSSSNTAVAYFLSSTAYIAAGAASASFYVRTGSVAGTAAATLSSAITGSSVSDRLTVTSLALKSVTLEQAELGSYGTTYLNNRVYLSGPAPAGGMVVYLRASNGYVSVPSSVLVAGGATSMNFRITASGVTSIQPVTISAWNSTGQVAANMTVAPVAVQQVELLPSTLVGGTRMLVKVRLNGPAPAGGLTVNVTSSDSTVLRLPATLTAAAGSLYASIMVTPSTVTYTHYVTVRAWVSGGTAKSSVLTVTR
jgi:hypothetical protein